MRKLVMSLSVLGGLLFAGTLPATANAAAGLTATHINQSEGLVQKAGWRGGWGHRGWGGGWGHRGWGGGWGHRGWGGGWGHRGWGGGWGWRHRGWGWGHRRWWWGIGLPLYWGYRWLLSLLRRLLRRPLLLSQLRLASPLLGPPSLGLGTSPLGLGTSSLGLGTSSLGLGTSSLGLRPRILRP